MEQPNTVLGHLAASGNEAASDLEAVRAAFERWYSDDGESPRAVMRSNSGGYYLLQAQSAWNAWQAACAIMASDESALQSSHAELVKALEMVLEAADGNHLTVGDCNEARAALDNARKVTQ